MMPDFSYRYAYYEDDTRQVQGTLELDQPLPFQNNHRGSGFYRHGQIVTEGYPGLEIVLYHSAATAKFIYVRKNGVDTNLLKTAGLTDAEVSRLTSLSLPGQLCLGAERVGIIGQAMNDIFSAPAIRPVIESRRQENLAIFPIAREGLKYQVADAIFNNFGYYCDEIVLDAHHVFDSSVPLYNRKVEMTLFKDKDLDQQQREDISVAFIADSIASGLVLKEVIARVKARFDHIQQIEVIAPLATVRGLTRLARSEFTQDFHVRVHVFETLLNALPPDFYYSAHYNLPEFHICPDLEQEYHAWWGVDKQGNAIADTACAGYGWSEVFFSPRKQIAMMNDQLQARHGLSIADILRRNSGL
jgi:hypothetical protein